MAKKKPAKKGSKKRISASRKRRPERRKWSGQVQSDALDLDPRVFTGQDPGRIAGSLKRSAERSSRHKGTPFQSAMSMLNFYINRAGRGLGAERRRVLEQAKVELRKRFGRGG